jgi:hypothetical protein
MESKKTKRGGALLLAVSLASLCFSRPANEWVVILCAALFLCSIYAFRDYPPRGVDGFQRFVRWGALLLICAAVSSAWGEYWWQTISPQRVSFLGYPNETFNFSVRNGRSDDVYDVQIPFLIGYDKKFQDKFQVKVLPNGDPPQRIYARYYYCFGTKGDGIISHVQPHEREVLIVNIPHLSANGNGTFTIAYEGGEKLGTESGDPTFDSEPVSYSLSQGTIGVRGDYRICKFAMGTDSGVNP